jgi:hypothetical protein
MNLSGGYIIILSLLVPIFNYVDIWLTSHHNYYYYSISL